MGDPRVLDPRRRETYNPEYHKRNASGSPDGARTQKVPRTNPAEKSPKVATYNSSRRSSEAPPTSAIDSRRPSNQLRTELRSAAPNESPDSMGSRYEDAQSGRSTPLTINGGLVRQQAAPAPPMFQGTTGVTNLKPIVDMLMAVGNQLTKVAAIRTEREQCETRLRQAHDEDMNMRKYYEDFPAVKEQKEAQKRIAERKVRDVEIRDAEQITVLRENMEAFAVLLSPAPRAQPVAEQIDPRVADRLSDGEKATAALEKKLALLETQYSDQFATMSAEISTLKAAAAPVTSVISVDPVNIAQVHHRLEKLETDMASYDKERDASDGILLGHVSEQLRGLEDRMDSTDHARQTALTQLQTGLDNTNRRIENTDATAAALETKIRVLDAKTISNFTTLNAAHEQMKTNLERASVTIAKKADDVATKEVLEKINTNLDSVADLLTTKAAEPATGNALDRIDATLNDLALKIGDKVDKAFVVNTMNAATQRFDAAARKAATPPTSVHGMHPPANALPQVNGAPSQALVRQVNDLERNNRVIETQYQARHQELMVKHDCLTRVTQELQRQYNNLTTEEVCTAVLAQFVTLWPHAHEYNNSIIALRTEMRGVQELAKDAKTQADAVATAAVSAANAMTAITAGEKKVEILSGQVLSHEGVLVEGKVAITKLNDTLEFLRDDIQRIDEKANSLEAKYLKLEASLKK